MKTLLPAMLAVSMAMAALAATVDYNTDGSTLLCGTAASCVQNNPDEVTLGGTLHLIYTPVNVFSIAIPSIDQLGNLTTSGTGSLANTAGVNLDIRIYSVPPGSSGTLPYGDLSGTLSTSSSTTSIKFSPSSMSSPWGTLPGVAIGTIDYVVLNPSLGLIAPTDGTPLGQTTIQGGVFDPSPTPEPSTLFLCAAPLIAFSVRRHRS